MNQQAMRQPENTDNYVEASLQELRLRPGTELELLDSKGKMLAHKAQFVALFAGKSALISLLVDNTRKIALRENESYTIKGFTGKHDFSFTSTVLHLDSAQFNARMSCPESVSVKFVRSHLRVQLALPSSVTLPGMDTPTLINIGDLSVRGASIVANAPLGAVGERLHLALPVEFDRKKINLHLASVIRHITQTEYGLRIGVEFVEPTQNDKLMLHYFVSTHSEDGAVI